MRAAELDLVIKNDRLLQFRLVDHWTYLAFETAVSELLPAEFGSCPCYWVVFFYWPTCRFRRFYRNIFCWNFYLFYCAVCWVWLEHWNFVLEKQFVDDRTLNIPLWRLDYLIWWFQKLRIFCFKLFEAISNALFKIQLLSNLVNREIEYICSCFNNLGFHRQLTDSHISACFIHFLVSVIKAVSWISGCLNVFKHLRHFWLSEPRRTWTFADFCRLDDHRGLRRNIDPIWSYVLLSQ